MSKRHELRFSKSNPRTAPAFGREKSSSVAANGRTLSYYTRGPRRMTDEIGLLTYRQAWV